MNAESLYTKNIIIEEWVYINGYDGLYSISSNGVIKSHSKRIEGGSDRIRKTYKSSTSGYTSVALSKNSKVKAYSVHRLVALHFIPNPNDFPQVLHIDNNKNNNSKSNLKWGTVAENVNQAYSDGLVPNKRNWVIPEIAINIFKSTSSLTSLSKIHNVSVATIRRIKNGKLWQKRINKYLKSKSI